MMLFIFICKTLRLKTPDRNFRAVKTHGVRITALSVAFDGLSIVTFHVANGKPDCLRNITILIVHSKGLDSIYSISPLIRNNVRILLEIAKMIDFLC